MNTEDFEVFGDQWVYCSQHKAVHKTNWCTVSVHNKIALGVLTHEEGIEKCRNLGLDLFCDNKISRKEQTAIAEDFRKCFDIVQKMDALFPDMKGAFTGSVSERLERHWNRMVEENNKETKND